MLNEQAYMDSLLDDTTFPVQGAENHKNDSLVYLIKDDRAMPAEYRCPITKMPMKNPVVMSDGHSYECLAIEEWLCTSIAPGRLTCHRQAAGYHDHDRQPRAEAAHH